MSYTEDANTVAIELKTALSCVSEEAAQQFVTLVDSADEVYVNGAGRSGYMARAFAMRLMHMGMKSYVVGDTVTPNIKEGDVLVVCSGSGETKSLVCNAEKAKSLGAKIALVTINPNSTIGRLADAIVEIPAPSPKSAKAGQIHSIQPEGSLFEQSLLIYLDLSVIQLMKRHGQTTETMFGRHANLE
jgi:6-phospho-3-hexuloisomerase